MTASEGPRSADLEVGCITCGWTTQAPFGPTSIAAAREHTQTVHPTPPPTQETTMTVLPDRLAMLDQITLDGGAHSDFNDGHCAMEVVSWLADEGFTDAPQVVDPDDREQMERFASLYDEAWRRIRDQHPERVGTPTYEIYAEMFRLFKDPNHRADVPEPLGFGAVVEDYDGALWVRVNGTHWHSEASPNNRQTWSELSPRRVLALGVEEADDA